MSVRSLLKPSLEKALIGTGAAALSRRLNRSSVAVLAYHNVHPRGVGPEGERTLHIDAATFGSHLDSLRRTHRIVSLRSIFIRVPWTGSRPRAVITFDDAYLGALTAGLDELRRRELKATVFVPPGLLGGRTFWWDALADPETGVVDPEVRRHALEELEGDQERVLAWAHRSGMGVRELRSPSLRSATEDQLRVAVQDGFVEPASHSWSHRNLAVLKPDEAKRDLERAAEWLSRRFPGADPGWVAYPYGLPPDVAPSGQPPHPGRGLGLEARLANIDEAGVVPRLNVTSHLTPEGLALRTSGVCRAVP